MMKPSGHENKKLIAYIFMTIFLVVIFARASNTTATELSSEFDVVILKTNNDERVNLAQETLASQLSQFNIPTIVKTVFNWENLTYEFDQSKVTSLLVLIGHGAEIGLYVGKEVVLWTTLKNSLIKTSYPWKLLLTCHSDEISDAERGIAGFLVPLIMTTSYPCSSFL